MQKDWSADSLDGIEWGDYTPEICPSRRRPPVEVLMVVRAHVINFNPIDPVPVSGEPVEKIRQLITPGQIPDSWYETIEGRPTLPRCAYGLGIIDRGVEVIERSFFRQLAQRLPGLRGLVLVNNLLKKLPREIGLLRNLEILNLSGNRLEELPEMGALHNLGGLLVAHNQLSALPGSLRCLHQLRCIDVHGNPLTSAHYWPRMRAKLRKMHPGIEIIE